MFQESLLESGGAPNVRRSWTTFASTVVQAALIATAALLPLVRPDVLPKPVREMPMLMPGGVSRATEAPNQAATRAPAGAVVSARSITAPLRIPAHVGEDGGPGVSSTSTVGNPSSTEDVEIPGWVPLGPTARVLPPPLPPTRSRPVQLSQGVTQGLLVSAPKPVYPQAAKVARIQGDVQLRAVISRNGEIEQLQVASGNPLLVTAAMDAVRRWKYRPYLLNGAPTEVETEITVRFVLSSE